MSIIAVAAAGCGSTASTAKQAKADTTSSVATSPGATRPAETTTLAPTTTTIPAPVVVRGSGNAILDVPAHDGPMIVHVTASGSSNFIVYALDASLQEGDLVANAIAPYEGVVPLDFAGSATTKKIKVDADGSYTLEFKDPRLARHFDATIAGANDDVLIYTGKTGILDYSNTGDSNFTAYYYDASGADAELLINEIGPITGQTTIQKGPGFAVVSGEKNWTLTVKTA